MTSISAHVKEPLEYAVKEPGLSSSGLSSEAEERPDASEERPDARAEMRKRLKARPCPYHIPNEPIRVPKEVEEAVLKNFEYDPITSHLYRKNPQTHMTRRVLIGNQALLESSDYNYSGYNASTKVKRFSLRYHAIVWFLLYKEWPIVLADDGPRDGTNQKGAIVRRLDHDQHNANEPFPCDFYQSSSTPEILKKQNQLREAKGYPAILRRPALNPNQSNPNSHEYYTEQYGNDFMDYYISYPTLNNKPLGHSPTLISTRAYIPASSTTQFDYATGKVSDNHDIALFSLALNRPLDIFQKALGQSSSGLSSASAERPDAATIDPTNFCNLNYREERELDLDDVPIALQEFHRLPDTYTPCYTDLETVKKLIRCDWNVVK